LNSTIIIIVVVVIIIIIIMVGGDLGRRGRGVRPPLHSVGPGPVAAFPAAAVFSSTSRPSQPKHYKPAEYRWARLICNG